MPELERAPKKLEGYFEQSKDPLNALVLCLPILLIYELGLLISDGVTLNGVDVVTVFLARRWGLNGLLAFNAGLFLTCLIAIGLLKREQRLNPKIVLPIIAESTVYALLMGTLIVLFMNQVLGLSATGAAKFSLSERVFLSLGAGFHEELIFRLFFYGGLGWSLARLAPSLEKPAYAFAFIASAVLFSLAHYAGAEAFAVRSFVFRFLAGCLLCALYITRGFAVAVYTHTIYDIYVMVLRNG